MRIPDGYILDNYIVAVKRMNIPARTVLESTVLEKDILALPEGDHDRPQEGLDLIFIEGRIRVIQGSGRLASLHVTFVGVPDRTVLRQDSASLEDGFPLIGRHLAFLDFPPIFPASVDYPASGDGYVLGFERVDRGEAAPYVQTLEVRVDDRIKILVGGEHEDSVRGDVEIDVVKQGDRTAEPDALRHNEMPASF